MPRDKHFNDDANRPPTGAEWEAMMRESELQAARFGELLETLHDHPDHERTIAKEMGWDHIVDALDAGEPPIDTEDGAESGLDDTDLNDIDDDDGEPFEIEKMDRGVKRIPAYAVCDRVGEAVRAILEPLQKDDAELDEDATEVTGDAFIGIHIACAKISGGHAMGYDDDTLCGNIVNNKRALEGARQSIRGFQELVALKLLPAEKVANVLPQLKEAEAAIEARIAELRAKVWWDPPKS